MLRIHATREGRHIGAVVAFRAMAGPQNIRAKLPRMGNVRKQLCARRRRVPAFGSVVEPVIERCGAKTDRRSAVRMPDELGLQLLIEKVHRQKSPAFADHGAASCQRKYSATPPKP